MSALLEQPSFSGTGIRPWTELASRVRDYAPDVVVLIARKAPRVRQAFNLDFGAGTLVVSDLALPFLNSICRGARVAIVDDVVNVGSTVRTAHDKVLAADATEARVFAIARALRDRGDDQLGDLTVDFVSDSPLDDAQLRQFASRIPDQLQALPKPYDLDFPLLRCQLASEGTGFADVLRHLQAQYPLEQSWDLTSPRGAAAGIRRAAVDLTEEVAGVHRKVRLYLDEESGQLNLVPIAVCSRMPTAPPTEGPGRRLWSDLEPVLAAEDIDARARLRLFCDSLSLGIRFLSDNSGWLRTGDEILDSDDAEMIFGPRARRFHLQRNEVFVLHPPRLDTPQEASASPFLERALAHDLPGRMRRHGHDAVSLFVALFDELAELVGASDPDEFAWDESRAQEMRDDPYQRLRIGPTSFDLVELLHRARGENDPAEVTRRQVTRLLDRFIDAGSVVPTTCVEDGRVYRIYRKGESDHKIDVADRVHFGLRAYGSSMSRTRLSKVMAALAFTDGSDSMVEVRNLQRGNTLAFSDDLLDAGTDVTAWLRDTGKIKRTEDK